MGLKPPVFEAQIECWSLDGGKEGLTTIGRSKPVPLYYKMRCLWQANERALSQKTLKAGVWNGSLIIGPLRALTSQ